MLSGLSTIRGSNSRTGQLTTPGCDDADSVSKVFQQIESVSPSISPLVGTESAGRLRGCRQKQDLFWFTPSSTIFARVIVETEHSIAHSNCKACQRKPALCHPTAQMHIVYYQYPSAASGSQALVATHVGRKSSPTDLILFVVVFYQTSSTVLENLERSSYFSMSVKDLFLVCISN
jgi:hypothetical protein